MNRGYIKVWRKIQDSGLMQMPNTLAFFMHILFNATHKDIKVGTSSGVIELKRGQYIDGLNRLANTLKQTTRQIRTSQQRLTDLEIISIKTTNKYSIYTIENYSKYQDSDTHNDNQTTIKRQSNDNQTTTKQEYNNLNIKEKNKSITQLALLIAMNIPEKLAKDYILVRKEKKQPITQTAMDKIKSHAESNNYTFAEAVNICVENSWAGFNVKWLENLNISKNGSNKSKMDISGIDYKDGVNADGSF